jgi:hydrogenase maturation protease
VTPSPLLVLGLGNVLCADDGLGVAALARLAERYACGPDVRLADGGTLGLSLLGWFEDADDVLIVDAILADAAPGTLVRLEGREVEPAARERLSVHQVGVADLLDALQLLGREPRRLALLGLVPERVALGLGLSPAVARGLPGLVETLADEIRRRGHPVTRRSSDEAPAAAPVARDAARALGL